MRDLARLERELICACLLEGDAADSVDVEPADFGDMRHRALWAAIRRLRADGLLVDPGLLEARCPEWSACGGYEYLATITSGGGLRDLLPSYAAELQAAGLTRRLRESLRSLADCDLEADELLEEAMRRLGDAGQRRTEAGRTMADWVAQTIRDLGRRMDDRQAGRLSPSGLSTGQHDLDGILCGVMRGVVTVIGARPSIGKSVLARCIAESVAQGQGVHYFSHEDSGDMVAMRSLAASSGVPVHRMLGVECDARDYGAIVGAADWYGSARWWLDDAAGLSSEQIALRVRRRRRQIGTALVVVDYVQLMRERGAKTMLETVARASSGLVRLAREENVAVLLLSQLSREAEKDGRPRLFHLRESGTLEQDAYAVMLLSRDRERNPDVLEVDVAKNKNGPIGMVRLAFDGPRMRVGSL